MATDSPDSSEPALERLFYHSERIRLVHWQEFSGAKTAVVLTGFVAVLAFVTGLSNLSRPAVTYDGPLAALLPWEPGVVQFTGVLLAFVLGALVIGLQRRKRLAWYLGLVTLPLATVLPLTTFQTTDIPLLLSVLVALPLLLVNRDAFDQRIELSSLQIASLSSIVGVVLYGTIGSYALQDQFAGLETWGDSVYYVVVTIATVGYGDITPLTTEAKWFSLSVILFGTGAFTVAIGSLIVPAIEKRMATAFGNMTPSELSLLEDHVLVLGHSDITESVLDELETEIDVVIVTRDVDDAAELNDRDVNVLTDDPTHEETLQDARVGDASGVVVATRDDANDVLAVLAARKANPEVRIVAAANDRQHVGKLEQVGADEVVSPTAIGGRLLGRSVLANESAESLFEDTDDA
ncbi:NAD-binding protein [Natronobacterium gregoryi]|uniref:Kef-type K+ ransport system, predicted NAD-binding component n=2 Tax=Natronobacterium gregoryi TaxID=44930 RepID=L0AKS7_NATGS|nr:NAD-binding protein [Natronobacterium gregoryi]AFZ74054.1 Kef-type K+ ransport system, predicted NAD-binding component [Natronobacterium gregoryi SP2]ELY70355.1 potassium channel-like protein [Natronobacterium gregoryi SP2]PLK20796.1 potassium channel protein [Natronobacterium gregoryi SP2]SFJ06686.1 voltage-gated potassium channel [Natronobacterium gregoryi]